MNRVWIVYKEMQDGSTKMVEICGNPIVAGGIVNDLYFEIKNLKKVYFDMYGFDFDEDWRFITTCTSVDMDTEKYISTSDRIFDFELENSMINVEKIYIKGRDVIN